MRISTAIIENFKGIKKITTTLQNGVFYICGKNESGKSSFIDGLMFALLGKKAFPKGKWKEIAATSGDKTLTGCVLVDDADNEVLKITRKIGKTGNESAVIENPAGKRFTQKELDGLIESVSLNPKAFMEMSPQEQTLFLGIDTSEIDAQYKQLELERRDTGRDVKRLAGAVQESYCEKPDGSDIDTNTLYQKLNDTRINNNEIRNAADASLTYGDKIYNAEQRVKELKLELDALNKICEKEVIPTEPIEAEIEKARNNQSLIQQHKMYLQSKSEHDAAEAKYTEFTGKLEKLKEDKVELIKSTKLPFKAISVDENGGLLIKQNGNYMPFNDGFFSTGRMWEIAIKVLSMAKPELKTVIVKDATLLDADKLKAISKTADDKGLQVLMEYVGDIEGENSITLVEGSIDGS